MKIKYVSTVPISSFISSNNKYAMEAEEDDNDHMIVVIVEEKDRVVSADDFPLEIKEEVIDEYESNEVNHLIETAERYGELIEVDIPPNIKLEKEDYDSIEELDECFENEEYNMDLSNDDLKIVNLEEEDEEEEETHRRQRRRKKLRSSECKSYIKELKKQHPEYIKDPKSLVQHLAEMMKALKPPAPPRDFFRVHDMDPLYECLKCSKFMKKVPETERHYQDHHGPRYLICYACGYDFRSKTNLYKHEKRCSAPDIGLVLRARAVAVGRKGRRRPFLTYCVDTPGPKHSRKYMCEQCPAVFVTRAGLTAHQHLHRGERPHGCRAPGCGAAYTSKSALARHISGKHLNMKFVCEHCGREFRLKHALVMHMDTHLPQKKFACPYADCERRFANRAHLVVHIDGRHRHLPPPCACELCPRRYVKMSLLKVHMKKAHGMILMTRKMFYKSLPKLTDTQVQQAKIFHESDLASRRRAGGYDSGGEERPQDGTVLLREDTGEFLPRPSLKAKEVQDSTEDVAEAGGEQDVDVKAYLDAILGEKCRQLDRNAKVVVIENGEVVEGAQRKDYERLFNALKVSAPDTGESMPEI